MGIYWYCGFHFVPYHLELKKRKLQIRQSSARLCPSPEIRSRFLELGWFRGNSATGANQDLATPSYIRLQPRELLSDFLTCLHDACIGMAVWHSCTRSSTRRQLAMLRGKTSWELWRANQYVKRARRHLGGASSSSEAIDPSGTGPSSSQPQQVHPGKLKESSTLCQIRPSVKSISLILFACLQPRLIRAAGGHQLWEGEGGQQS